MYFQKDYPDLDTRMISLEDVISRTNFTAKKSSKAGSLWFYYFYYLRNCKFRIYDVKEEVLRVRDTRAEKLEEKILVRK